MKIDTQHTIALWGLETFGPRPTHEIAARANVEMAELVSGLATHHTTSEMAPEIRAALLDECADVLIMLYQVADKLGGDLHGEVQRKMAVNRCRVWGRTPTGKMQHVSEFVEPETGLTMRIGQWYLIDGDTGAVRYQVGFTTAEDALDWAMSDEGRAAGCTTPVVSRFVPEQVGFSHTIGTLVMLADDLYRFWQVSEHVEHFEKAQAK